MIFSLFFVIFVFALFYYVISPFFEKVQKISPLEVENEMKEFFDSALKNFSDDCETGQITDEEIEEIKANFDKEMDKNE